MDTVITNLVFLMVLIGGVSSEVCYEYQNSNTRAFECTDGCCGSRTDAYCCMSPILIVGIAVGAIAGLIIIGVIIFICYQKYKQKKMNEIQQISIDQLSGAPTPRKSKKDKNMTKGGTMDTAPEAFYNKPLTHTNGIHEYDNNTKSTKGQDNNLNPLPPPARTGTWLFKTNNNPANNPPQMNGQLPPPPPPAPALPKPQPVNPNVMGPIKPSTNSTAELFNIPAHPGAAELYSDTSPIRPLPGSLPPLPPVQPKQ